MTHRLLAVAIAALLTPGCLEGDLDQTIYLDPDGSATWMVLEKEIRSATGNRATEEKEFLAPYRNGEYQVAQVLKELGAASVETQLLRSERPFWVLTTAEFVAVDTMLQRYIRESDEVMAQVWIEGAHDERRLVVRYRPEENDGNVNILLDDELRIYLTSGKFTGAEGFEISNGSAATPLAVPESDIDSDGGVTLSLSWKVEKPVR